MAKSGTLTVKIVGDAAPFSKALGDATSKAEKFGQKLSSVGNKLSVGLTLPLVALGAKATQAAGDLGESINAVNVVFGEGADKIHEFGKVAATEAGLSARAFNELVTPVGAALQNVGFGADEAAEASINLGKRAADMASVFNVDVSEALSAIQAGLRGEADPLERFGVGLSAAAVDAHALEMGLADTAAELDDNARAQARVSLLMEQTDKVAGDFKNTSEDVANAQRIAAARAEDLAASFGNKLIPIKTKLLEIGMRLLDWFDNLDQSGQNTVLMVAGVAASLGPLAKMLSSVISIVRGLSVAMAFLAANPIVLVIAAVAALVAGLVIAYQKSETFREIVNAAFRMVKGGALELAKVAVQAFQFLVNAWLSAAEGIAGAAVRAFGWVPGLGDKLRNASDQVNAFKDRANSAMDAVVKELDVQINANEKPLLQAVSRAQAALNSLGATVRIDGAGGRVSGVRAAGGPVWPGGSFLVGEEGPELFTPSTAGTIIPNGNPGRGLGSMSRAGSAPVVNVTVQGNLDQVSLGQVRREIAGAFTDFTRQITVEARTR